MADVKKSEIRFAEIIMKRLNPFSGIRINESGLLSISELWWQL